MEKITWVPWQLAPDSDPEQRWILVDGSDYQEEHPDGKLFASQQEAEAYAEGGQ